MVNFADREKIYHNNVRTVEETHLLKSTGSVSENFSEEHWSSEIKSYIAAEPPKFVQVQNFDLLFINNYFLVW